MRRATRSVSDQHRDWLVQVATEGPFLALPVLKDIWPQGVDRLGDTDDRALDFKQAFVMWQRELDTYELATKTDEAKRRYADINRVWIDTVLKLAGWDSGLRMSADDLPAGLGINSPGELVRVRPSGGLRGRGDDGATALLLVAEPTSSLRDPGLDGWAADEIDRMAMLLRSAGVECGVVTDGQWWALVWAKESKPTGSGMVNALTWAEEPLLRDAFLTLIDQRRFRAKDVEQRLPRLFERSELEAEEITEALGTQVRKSVELIVQAFSEARLEAQRNGDPDPLTDDADQVYQAAVTVMMRIVFLLFAEEREMLPTEQLYWDSYAIRDLLARLEQQALDGEEHLDESFDAWHRLLAVSQALYAGVNYDEMRMPAYGGSLLSPDRFPWLHATDARGLGLQVSDRVMMHALKSVQTVVVKGERRHISFRDIDVEQIGYIYEGLLGYTCAPVTDDVVLGLVGKDGVEPEIPATTLQGLYDDSADAKSFATALLAWVKSEQPAATCVSASRLAKLYDAPVDEPEEMRRLLTPAAAGDEDLLGFLIDWSQFIRRDLRGLPLVVPIGGLVVEETPSRKNAGAHYTPRSLAEEVVLHALQPLVYEPGPLQTNDETEWRLKSSTAILDLKVADIAAGSGAFLVAAARYLADRVTEAWQDEGMLGDDEISNPQLARDRAIREVIARCLYGADINPMAVEMCKLSLWLVSMDRTKPFSFVDDKILCGNSLLGVTSLDQLRFMHLYPDATRMDVQLLVDVDGKIATATRIRKELASPVEEQDIMRSTRGKRILLEELRRTTADLKLIADGIIAAGLELGGKPGTQLDDAYRVLGWELSETFSRNGFARDSTKVDRRVAIGLKPSVVTDFELWEPLHWAIEAPDVLIERGGFDAVIGNPPFLGGKKISSALGANVREYMVNALAGGAKGHADLVAYFFLRVRDLVGAGCLGLIATNTIAEGDTREVGLTQLLKSGWGIRRSIKSSPWPSSTAALEYACVWACRPDLHESARRVADGLVVDRIGALLERESRTLGQPLRLAENRARMFIGSYINGAGFTIDADTAHKIRSGDPRSQDVIRPLLNADDLVSQPSSSSDKFVIDFGDRDISDARKYSGAFSYVEENVRAYRQTLVKKPRQQQNWWQFERRAVGLYQASAGLDGVVVMPIVSKVVLPVRCATGQVFTHGVAVRTSDSCGELALLSSVAHQMWAITWGGTLETRVRYTPSDVFETFPRPQVTDQLEAVGRSLDVERREIMLNRYLGLTALYNQINNLQNQGDPDIERMRQIHVEVDWATMAAYGWGDIPLDHGFHTYRQMERWTVSPAARVEILDRLLELNHERARAEGQNVPDQPVSAPEDTLLS